MLGAAPIGRRGVSLVAVALAALAAVPATAHAQSGAATPRSQELPDLWALEVTPEFAASVRPRLMARTKKRGLNTLVLNRNLSREQSRRVRSLARRFDLRVVQLRLRVCKRAAALCAVVARRPAAVGRLSRMRHVDIVVLRLRGPGSARRLTQKYVRAANGTASARLLLLPRLKPRFSRAPWRRAIRAVADVRPVDLGVTPTSRASRRALNLVLGLLAVPPSSQPPPPPPPPAGQLYFRGDWEVTEPILGQWSGAQCENTSAVRDDATWNRGRLYVVSDLVAEGEQAMRVDLPGDGERRQACEALHGRKLGTGHGFPPFEEWYALSIRFPANLTTQGWGMTVTQFGYQGIWGSPIHITAHGPADSGEPNHVRLEGQAGECLRPPDGGDGCEWSSGLGGNVAPMRIIPPGRFATEVWHDFLVHVVWTTKPSEGLIEAWHRPRGGSWIQTVPPLTGYPTVQWEPGTTLQPTHGSVDKIGAYRNPNATALSIWHDNFCSGSTRAVVEACL
jgi:hypothetical protein